MDDVISQFPAFKVGSGNTSVGALAYLNLMAGFDGLKIYKWTENMPHLHGGIESGPLVLFDMHDHVIIISAFNHFTAASYSHDTTKKTIGWGIMGKVDDVPQGYSLQTMMFYSDKGINQVQHMFVRNALPTWLFTVGLVALTPN